MGQDIDETMVRRLATLSALELTDDEAVRIAGELSRIVEHIDRLQAVDVSDVPPMTHVHAARTPLRADEVLASLPRAQALAEAPDTQSGGFAVPAFVDEG